MVVRIRFARHGRMRQPFYRIVAMNARSAQRGMPFEYVRLLRHAHATCTPGGARSTPRAAAQARFARSHTRAGLTARPVSRGAQLGTYNPRAGADGVKELRLNLERIKYWLGVGAQPTEPVAKLLGRAGVLPAYPRRQSVQKAQPKKERGFHSFARPGDVAAQLPPCTVSAAGPVLRAGLPALPWLQA